MTILDFFAKFATAIVGLLSLIVAFFAYLYQKNQKKKQKACELAKYYADFIIPRFRFVASVFEQIDLHVETDRFKGKMRRFDEGEFAELWGNTKGIETYLNKISYEILKIASVKSLYDPNTHCEFSDKLAKEDYPRIFDKLVVYLINDLEAFSMYFRYNIADDKLVYQPLHRTFLSRTSLLYYYLSRKNYKTDERCFVNIIELYCKWEKRRIKQKRRVDSYHVAVKGSSL